MAGSNRYFQISAGIPTIDPLKLNYQELATPVLYRQKAYEDATNSLGAEYDALLKVPAIAPDDKEYVKQKRQELDSFMNQNVDWSDPVINRQMKMYMKQVAYDPRLDAISKTTAAYMKTKEDYDKAAQQHKILPQNTMDYTEAVNKWLTPGSGGSWDDSIKTKGFPTWAEAVDGPTEKDKYFSQLKDYGAEIYEGALKKGWTGISDDVIRNRVHQIFDDYYLNSPDAQQERNTYRWSTPADQQSEQGMQDFVRQKFLEHGRGFEHIKTTQDFDSGLATWGYDLANSPATKPPMLFSMPISEYQGVDASSGKNLYTTTSANATTRSYKQKGVDKAGRPIYFETNNPDDQKDIKQDIKVMSSDMYVVDMNAKRDPGTVAIAGLVLSHKDTRYSTKANQEAKELLFTKNSKEGTPNLDGLLIKGYPEPDNLDYANVVDGKGEIINMAGAMYGETTMPDGTTKQYMISGTPSYRTSPTGLAENTVTQVAFLKTGVQDPLGQYSSQQTIRVPMGTGKPGEVAYKQVKGFTGRYDYSKGAYEIKGIAKIGDNSFNIAEDMSHLNGISESEIKRDTNGKPIAYVGDAYKAGAYLSAITQAGGDVKMAVQLYNKFIIDFTNRFPTITSQ